MSRYTKGARSPWWVAALRLNAQNLNCYGKTKPSITDLESACWLQTKYLFLMSDK
jgi:hypothetical protein